MIMIITIYHYDGHHTTVVPIHNFIIKIIYDRPKTEYYVMMISYRLTVLCFVLLVPTAD